MTVRHGHSKQDRATPKNAKEITARLHRSHWVADIDLRVCSDRFRGHFDCDVTLDRSYYGSASADLRGERSQGVPYDRPEIAYIWMGSDNSGDDLLNAIRIGARTAGKESLGIATNAARVGWHEGERSCSNLSASARRLRGERSESIGCFCEPRTFRPTEIGKSTWPKIKPNRPR